MLARRDSRRRWPACSTPACTRCAAACARCAGRYDEARGRPRARAPADRRPPRQHPVHAADGVRAGGDRPGAAATCPRPAQRRSPSALDADPEGWNVRYGWPLIWLGMRVEAESGRARPRERVAGQRRALAADVPGRRPDELAAYRALTAAERARIDAVRRCGSAAVEAARAGNAPYLLRLRAAAPRRGAASRPATARRPRAR